jgi:putative endonuclease
MRQAKGVTRHPCHSRPSASTRVIPGRALRKEREGKGNHPRRFLDPLPAPCGAPGVTRGGASPRQNLQLSPREWYSAMSGGAGWHMKKSYCVYIITNKRNGTLYIGITSNLPQRMMQHKSRAVPGFASRYGLDRLVWFEIHGEVTEAIAREKQLKGWNRAWKIKMIESSNPEWNELDATIV